MKKILFILSFATLLAACNSAQNEKPAERKYRLLCDSIEMREVDPKTGIETITKVWRCDTVYEPTEPK